MDVSDGRVGAAPWGILLRDAHEWRRRRRGVVPDAAAVFHWPLYGRSRAEQAYVAYRERQTVVPPIRAVRCHSASGSQQPLSEVPPLRTAGQII